jgi:hypothetical protein
MKFLDELAVAIRCTPPLSFDGHLLLAALQQHNVANLKLIHLRLSLRRGGVYGDRSGRGILTRLVEFQRAQLFQKCADDCKRLVYLEVFGESY